MQRAIVNWEYGVRGNRRAATISVSQSSRFVAEKFFWDEKATDSAADIKKKGVDVGVLGCDRRRT